MIAILPQQLRLTLFFLLLGTGLSASKLARAFEALARYDYFKAKDLFYSANKKTDPFASYGLAVIYHRNDNPFYNLDSAVKYLNRGLAAYREKGEPRQFEQLLVDTAAYRILADSVSERMFRETKQQNTVAAYEWFLRTTHLASRSLKDAAIEARDGLEFKLMQQVNRSSATKEFMVAFPESNLYREAFALFERQVFEEATGSKSSQAYLSFIVKHPGNKMVNQAYEKLFGIYRERKDSKGMATFVTQFPDAPQNLEAWKLLFTWSVKAYSYTELKKFLDQYPQFPLKNSILHELELNKLVLYPYSKGEQVGFIDEEGSMKIAASFDAANPFSEGLSVVHKGDSAWYINKENVNPFNRSYVEAANFRNGIAPVKINDSWYFVNRLGQVISKPYQEINEFHDNAYVVRKNGQYGALDQFGQVLIEPRFEKLGDLRNDIAYYLLNGKYGFVSPDGYTHPAEFEWLSDFSDFGQAVFKTSGKFGLIERSGNRVLPAEYDQVLRQNDSIYLVVKSEQYGFYHARGCFIFSPNNDYLIGIQSGRFTNGEFFKLNRKKQQAIANANGQLLTAFGAFDEVELPSEGLMRVKKRGKYGYADVKGSLLIPHKYDQAGSFLNKLSVVQVKDKYIVLHHSGKEVFTSTQAVIRLGRNYFVTGAGPSQIISSEGTILFSDARNIQQVAEGVYAFERESGEIRLLYD